MKFSRTNNIQRLLAKLQDKEPVLQQVGELLVNSTKARIASTKTSPDGSPFAPWSFATLKARQKDGSASSGILLKTGRLLNSIEYQIQGDQVVVGANSSAPYANFLQVGTPNMPARPFVGISQPDTELIQSVLRKHLNSL